MSTEVLKLVWDNIRKEAKYLINSEPILYSFFHSFLLQHEELGSVLSYVISARLSTSNLPFTTIRKIFEEAYRADPSIVLSAAFDIYAIVLRDPVVDKYLTPLLYFKGFHALQAYRVSHWLWNQNRCALAMYFQHQISVSFGVDVHPAAVIGFGIIFDHATGIVIGETSVIENNVSILQSVTLGSTGKVIGDRHPKIREGVIIGAGAIVLGNIEVGYKSKIGAGAIVLRSVPSYSTVIGESARVIDKYKNK